MPGTIRKVAIFAGEEGLVVQSLGPEHHQSIGIEYGSRRIAAQSTSEHSLRKTEAHLESYGIIGLINIASLSFLIAVTRREQVAQIYGKPIYVIVDVAILPLSSQSEAREALGAASQAQNRDHDVSDSDHTDSEDDEDHQRLITAAGVPGSPGEEDVGPYTHRNKSNSSIAEDVAKRKASYGKFASRWFFKQVWGASKTTSEASGELASNPTQDQKQTSIETQKQVSSEAAEINDEPEEDTAEKEDIEQRTGSVGNASAASLLPKVLRSAKMILSSKSFYFAYDFDLTRRFSLQSKRALTIDRDRMDPVYVWNRRMGSSFVESGQEHFLLPVVQGFVGQRNFGVKSKPKPGTESHTSDEGHIVQTEPNVTQDAADERTYLLTLISRRSVKRSGLRYLRRGIDDDGNCANMVESEQVLSSPDWDRMSNIRSFVQVRGSIPLYFSQSPYSFKPVPMLHNSPSANVSAFKRHFHSLKAQYGAVQIAVLVDKHGTEVAIGNAYEKLYRDTKEAGQLESVDLEWFDFHAECRGMKFENVQRLVDKLQDTIAKSGETVISDDTLRSTQSGVIRTNCMDCLDRTNVAQSAFGQHVLQRNLEEDGYSIDLLHDESTNWFNVLWADNGDAISRQYASTAALKGDFTRTRKRNWRGQMNDLGLTLSRYYSNMVNDYFSQAVIDVLLGNVSWKIFEDFESSMMSRDPGISVEAGRENAIENCAKIVIQEADEDLIHGWTMLTPAQENTLRTLPFEEVVVLLTNAAIYCCRFDWNIEKVASFEKVDLRSISKIRQGTYITSTFTERQLDEDLNQGLVVVFTPGKGNVIRVNTRSMSNAMEPETQDRSSVDGGTGILSWFAPRSASSITPRTLALKVIASTSSAQGEEAETSRSVEPPANIASQICEDIKRATVVSSGAHDFSDFVEQGDIISAADAKRRTGYLEQIGQSIRRMVWT